jgi:hypothetical protein
MPGRSDKSVGCRVFPPPGGTLNAQLAKSCSRSWGLHTGAATRAGSGAPMANLVQRSRRASVISPPSTTFDRCLACGVRLHNAYFCRHCTACLCSLVCWDRHTKTHIATGSRSSADSSSQGSTSDPASSDAKPRGSGFEGHRHGKCLTIRLSEEEAIKAPLAPVPGKRNGVAPENQRE